MNATSRGACHPAAAEERMSIAKGAAIALSAVTQGTCR
jgi:hypothetical protein